MRPADNSSWLARSPWTVTLGIVVFVLNVGLFPSFGGFGANLLTALEFDNLAIRQGEWWRILTGSLVHASENHFFMDFLAFCVLGLLYEQRYPRSYPWLLLWIAVVVGVAELLYYQERTHCRGLSGVTAGQFAVALCWEVGRTKADPRRWLWVGPALACYTFWLAYGALTGKALFVSDNGTIAVVSHIAGAAAGVVFFGIVQLLAMCKNRSTADQSRFSSTHTNVDLPRK